MNGNGKVGCGCLIFLLIIVLVAIGLFVHPISLRFVANQLRYEDKIFASDALYVPRFGEDRDGEAYREAFREFGAGNARVIWIEEETVLGTSIIELVQKMAKTVNVKPEAIRKMEIKAGGPKGAAEITAHFVSLNARKVIVIVPEYASRRYHLLLGSAGDDRTIFLVRPVKVSYFKRDSWWKDPLSRSIVFSELFGLARSYIDGFTSGDAKK